MVDWGCELTQVTSALPSSGSAGSRNLTGSQVQLTLRLQSSCDGTAGGDGDCSKMGRREGILNQCHNK